MGELSHAGRSAAYTTATDATAWGRSTAGCSQTEIALHGDPMDLEGAKQLGGYVGVASALFMGGRSFLRFVREYRLRNKPGLTVKNGEYTELMREIRDTRRAVSRVENRQDAHTRAVEALGERVTSIEDRMSRA